MSNTLITPSLLAKRALMVLENQLTFTKNANTEYSDQFAKSGAKIGSTINVRKPPRFVGRDGQALQVEAITENYVPVTITDQAGVDISLSQVDMTLSIDHIEERILRPAMATVANKIDVAGTQLYKDIFRIVNHGASAAGYGTSGGLNGGSATYAGVAGQIMTAGAILTESGVPNDGNRALCIDPMSNVSASSVMTNIFNRSNKLPTIFDKGSISGSALGFEWGEDANMSTFTPLASGTATNLSAAPASGATTVSIVCTGTAVLKRGDVFSLAGVYAINPQSRVSTGRLMQFVVTADTQLSAATVSIPMYPAYIPSGQYATCTGTATTGAGAVTWHTGAVGGAAQSQNLAYHKNAFTLATADMELPRGVHIAERVTHNGITMSMISAYDINSNQMPLRFDVLFGWRTMYPELAVRVGG